VQIDTGGLIAGNIVVFIPNTVGLEELLKRATTESTRMGVDLDLHELLHHPVSRKLPGYAMSP
jgi:hypothetical protein